MSERFEYAACAMIVVDPEGTIAEANRAAEQLFGQLLVGRPFLDLVAPGDRDYTRLRLLKDNHPAGTELTALGADGRELTVELSTSNLGGAVLVVLSDVTERNRLRQQAAQADKLAAVATLAAGIAHEINNPIAYVLANLGFLKVDVEAVRVLAARLRALGEEKDSKRKLALVDELVADPALSRFLLESSEMVRECQQGAERVRDIVKGIKGFARVDDTEIGAVSVNELLDTALTMCAPEIERRARVERDYAPDLPQLVVSPGRLNQVFVNLLANAAHAIEEGAVDKHRIRVRTARDDDRVRIDISDTGKGIAPELLPHIFDPFFSTKPIGAGSGLGLPVSHEVVRGHGGDIQVTSTPGRGTTVTVHLPLQSGRLAPEKAVAPPASATRARVLIVDDEEFLLRVFKRMIGQRHDVTTALGGRAAMARLAAATAPFDAIVSDLAMPDVSGLELHRHVAEKYPGLERRMVFVTGGAYSRDGKDFLQRVPNIRLDKPFQPHELLGALDSVLTPQS
jgi:PAS domain S-box-containing protein